MGKGVKDGKVEVGCGIAFPDNMLLLEIVLRDEEYYR